VSTIVTGGERVGVVGTWRIVEMDLWDIDAIDLVEPAFVAFERDGDGGLLFVAVRGRLDWRTSAQGRGDRVEFTWEGDDEGDRVSGRGWAQVDEDGSLRGHFYFHLGDDSGFRAVRETSAAT
jgi:hypothetical protein